MLRKALGESRVRSGGFSKPNKPAAKKVRDYAADCGIDLSEHRSSPITAENVAWADLIVYMDGGNAARLGNFGGEAALSKAVCLGWAIGEDRIHDPAFVNRGPLLNELLALIVRASYVLAQSLLKGGFDRPLQRNKNAPPKAGHSQEQS